MSNDKHTPTPIGYILLRSFSIRVRENGSHNWKIVKGTLVPDYKKKRLYVSENSALEAISQMKTFYTEDDFKAIPVFTEQSETIATLRAEKAELIEALRDARTVLYMCENSLLNCGYGVESSTIKSIQKASEKLSKLGKP